MRLAESSGVTIGIREIISTGVRIMPFPRIEDHKPPLTHICTKRINMGEPMPGHLKKQVLYLILDPRFCQDSWRQRNGSGDEFSLRTWCP